MAQDVAAMDPSVEAGIPAFMSVTGADADAAARYLSVRACVCVSVRKAA